MRKRTRAFTLVEVLIVVLVLAILAAIVIPQLSGASARGRASMLADDVRLLRSQIQVYKAQHNVPPGYPNGNPTRAATAQAFNDQMTLLTNATGTTAALTADANIYMYGPYMQMIPVNPVNGLATVWIIADGAAFPTSPDNNYGWIYQASSTMFKDDSTGNDDTGNPYFNY
jgi:prepilin-type N-terminal cleavage/methylation domain-containing protein